MPTTTTDAFNEYDENLKLDPDQRDGAVELHNDVTALLTEKGLITSAFLQGSFRRKTMIAPLRDVDKVVILHPDLAGLSPDEVMDRLQGALAEAYPEATFDRSRHALQMDFGEDSFYFDTVPAWESTTNDTDVCIANRDSGGWQRSNTRELIRVIAARNGATNGLWIHQIRMAKQVIKHLLDGDIPGLHVESWAYIAITEATDHDEALTRILETGAALLGGTYTEPTGVEAISDRLKPDVIARAKPILTDAAGRARAARAASDSGDHIEAISIWHNLCGDSFPAPSQDAAAALSRAFAGGAVNRDGTISTSRTGTQRSQPTRSWRRT